MSAARARADPAAETALPLSQVRAWTQAKRDWLCCLIVPGSYMGPLLTPLADPTEWWLIAPLPLPSAHRWGVGLKVDGEHWHHTNKGPDLRQCPLLSTPPPPHTICTLQVSSGCPWCHFSLGASTEDSFISQARKSSILVLSDLWRDYSCSRVRRDSVLVCWRKIKLCA